MQKVLTGRPECARIINYSIIYNKVTNVHLSAFYVIYVIY